MGEVVSRQAELVLRPSWRKYGRSILRRLSPLVIVVIAIQFWLGGPVTGRDSGFGFLALGLMVIVFAADIVYRMSTVVRILPAHVVIEVMRFVRRDVPRASVAGVALRGVVSYISYLGTQLYAVIYDRHHRCITTLPEGIWDEEDLRRLQAALGAEDHLIKFVSSSELSTEFPGALSLERYLGWGLAVVVIALILVASTQSR